MAKTSMTSGKGMYSTTDNPMAQPSRTSPKCGPGSNKDQSKANKLLQKAQSSIDSLRGKSGM